MSQPVEVIRLQIPTAICCICGQEDESRWGVPIAMDGELVGSIVANEYQGDWAGKPACRVCWAEHEEGKHIGIDPPY